ncbi:PucR family transcriptional regulator ligand-binding domain-containing protein [Kitasatospora arboriphila]
MPALTVREVLALDVLGLAAPLLLAYQGGLDRPVRRVHTGGVPEGCAVLSGGELLLTDGHGLARATPQRQRAWVRELAGRGAAALFAEVGRALPRMPRRHGRGGAAGAAAGGTAPGGAVRPGRRGGELRDRSPSGDRSPARDRPGGPRPAALPGRLRGAGADRRTAGRDGRGPRRSRRPRRPGRIPATGGSPGAGPGGPRPPAGGAGPFHRTAARPTARPTAGSGAGHRPGGRAPWRSVRAAGGAARPGPGACRPGRAAGGVPAGSGGRPRAGRPRRGRWVRFGESLREAVATLGLAVTVPSAEPCGPGPQQPYVTTARAFALERELTRSGGPERWSRLAGDVLGPLLAWESRHAGDLVRTLEVHLRHGCSPTRTAALLHIGLAVALPAAGADRGAARDGGRRPRGAGRTAARHLCTPAAAGSPGPLGRVFKACGCHTGAPTRP